MYNPLVLSVGFLPIWSFSLLFTHLLFPPHYSGGNKRISIHLQFSKSLCHDRRLDYFNVVCCGIWVLAGDWGYCGVIWDCVWELPFDFKNVSNLLTNLITTPETITTCAILTSSTHSRITSTSIKLKCIWFWINSDSHFLLFSVQGILSKCY